MTRPTGEDLYQELCAAAAAARVGVRTYAAALYPTGDANWKLEQLRIARRPQKATIERVRALIRGEELPPPAHARPGDFDRRYQQHTRAEIEAMGLPPSGRAQRDLQAVEQQRRRREYTELLRELTARVYNDRRPGQTIADRVSELRQDLAA
jgi:hypothetical protein